MGLLEKEVGADLRAALWGLFRKVGEMKFGMPEYVRPRADSVGATPTSPGQRFDWDGGGGRRRESKVSRTGGA